MLRLDSIKLDLNEATCWDPSRFDRTTTTKPTGQQLTRYSCFGSRRTGRIGLSSVHVVAAADGRIRANVEVSSKILGPNHAKLISLDTVTQVADEICASGVLEVDPQSLLDATVCKASITNDIRLSENIATCLTALSYLGVNSRFTLTEYRGSVVFRSKAKRDQKRLILYDKYSELLTAKNKPFISSVPSALTRAFEGVLRIEQSCYSQAALRRAKGVKEYRKGGRVTLRDLLETKHPSNLTLYREIAAPIDPNSPIMHAPSSGLSLHRFEKRLGREQILRDCHFDIQLVRKFLKSMTKGNFSKILREYHDLAFQMEAENGPLGAVSTIGILNEIEEALVASCGLNYPFAA